mmetsp:Transcript_120357/g.275690  ORF Transcript_120357/g.275690 Transcript_120357/m.275690 type:complete len:250 (+) Transcript_120357:854-1603(+)
MDGVRDEHSQKVCTTLLHPAIVHRLKQLENASQQGPTGSSPHSTTNDSQLAQHPHCNIQNELVASSVPRSYDIVANVVHGSSKGTDYHPFPEADKRHLFLRTILGGGTVRHHGHALFLLEPPLVPGLFALLLSFLSLRPHRRDTAPVALGPLSYPTMPNVLRVLLHRYSGWHHQHPLRHVIQVLFQIGLLHLQLSHKKTVTASTDCSCRLLRGPWAATRRSRRSQGYSGCDGFLHGGTSSWRHRASGCP